MGGVMRESGNIGGGKLTLVVGLVLTNNLVNQSAFLKKKATEQIILAPE